MRYKYIALALFLFVHISFSAFAAKHALIFAVSKYPTSKTGWIQISSDHDVDLMTKALERQDFLPGNIKTVTDEQVTVAGISQAFDQLISKVAKGDIVVVHFSCHGAQLEADRNSVKTDGLDECIVTYDAVSKNKDPDRKSYSINEKNYYRDHILGDKLNELRAHLGKDGDLVVFMDFCHSGSATRGGVKGKRRGGEEPYVSADFNPLNHRKSDSSLLARQSIYLRPDESQLSSIEVFSATRPEEVDYETEDDSKQPAGPLSYAVSKSLEHLEPGTTYRSLFARIQAIMGDKVPDQHPLLEGTGQDRMLFGGNFVAQKRYVEIDEIQKGNKLKLKAGLLAGLGVGAKVVVDSALPGSPADANLLAKGTVIESHNYYSIVQLDNDVKIKQPSLGWVFITGYVYNIEPIAVKLVTEKTRSTTPSFSNNDISLIKKGLSSLPLIKLDDAGELWITKGKNEDSILINASNGYLFDTIKSAADTARLKEKIQNYAQYKFLKSFNTKEDGVSVQVKLVPVIHGIADTNYITAKTNNGTIEFSNHDSVIVWIKNMGTRAVYVNILDLQPDGIINPILPYTKKKIYPQDLHILPGGVYEFDPKQYWIKLSKLNKPGKPYDDEVFKVFAATTQINMEEIATTRGATTRSAGSFSALESLVKKNYSVTTRGADVETLGEASGTTYDIPFRIKQ